MRRAPVGTGLYREVLTVPSEVVATGLDDDKAPKTRLACATNRFLCGRHVKRGGDNLAEDASTRSSTAKGAAMLGTLPCVVFIVAKLCMPRPYLAYTLASAL